jgi:hypothetical protein
MSLRGQKKEKRARSSMRDFFRQVKSLHYATDGKDQLRGFTVVLKKNLIFYFMKCGLGILYCI